MKKAMNNYSKMAMVLFAAISMGISTIAWAGTEKETPQAELRFVGTVGEFPSFQLILNNAVKGEFLVTVKDGEKAVLFSEKLKGEMISRVYKLDEKERGIIDGTTFEVTNLTTNETRVFKVNKVVREVIDVTVSKN